jgi:hypothetical protein
MSDDVGLTPTIQRVLELACVSLGVDLAWVSEFVDGQQVFRAVYGEPDRFGSGPVTRHRCRVRTASGSWTGVCRG